MQFSESWSTRPSTRTRPHRGARAPARARVGHRGDIIGTDTISSRPAASTDPFFATLRNSRQPGATIVAPISFYRLAAPHRWLMSISILHLCRCCCCLACSAAPVAWERMTAASRADAAGAAEAESRAASQTADRGAARAGASVGRKGAPRLGCTAVAPAELAVEATGRYPGCTRASAGARAGLAPKAA